MTSFQGHPIPRLEELRKERLVRELVMFLNRGMWKDAKRLMLAEGAPREEMEGVISLYHERFVEWRNEDDVEASKRQVLES